MKKTLGLLHTSPGFLKSSVSFSFLYSSLPNLPSHSLGPKTCWVLRLLGLSITRKVFLIKVSHGPGCHQVIFSEYVCTCVFIRLVESKHLLVYPPPTSSQSSERAGTEGSRLQSRQEAPAGSHTNTTWVISDSEGRFLRCLT